MTGVRGHFTLAWPRRVPTVSALAATVAVALAVAVVACTSSPPLPSAGTQTPTLPPAASALESTAANASPGSSAGATNLPTPVAQPSTSAVQTSPPTMPPGDAIAAELETPGSLTVCVALLGAPAASLDDHGQPSGYNVAFAKELADRLSLQPVIQQADFGELISMLQAHACDVSVSSQNITSDRLVLVNLIPYTQSKLGFPVVVAKGNPLKIQLPLDLCGKSVSAATGSTGVDAVQGGVSGSGATNSGINANCAANGASAVDLHTYPSELDAVQALLDKSAVAYIGNANFVDQYPDVLDRSDLALPPAQQGIGVALDHPNTTTALDAAVGAMINDGTYLQILRQYLPGQSVDNFSIIPVP